MNQNEIAIARDLNHCTFPVASWDKRFARNIAFVAQHSPNKDLTEGQTIHLLRLTYKYRRQVGAKILELAYDEMERNADRRVANGMGALPDFRPKRRRELKPGKAQSVGLPSLPLFDESAKAEVGNGREH